MPTYTVNLQSWASVSGPGSIGWFNPGNAEYADGSIAKTNAVAGTGATTYLEGTNPTPISPAANEVIQSITATATRASTGATTDDVIALIVGGNVTSMNKASGATWPSTLTATTYNWSFGDLLSLGIVLATVQASNFGVALAANLNGASGNGATVDAIVLTIDTAIQPAPVGGNNVLPPYGIR